MNTTFPYQKLLFRILHNLLALFVILAILTAIWTYNTYDARILKIPLLPPWREIEGIHGTFGLFTILILPFFVIYCFHRGNAKLIQKDTLAKIKLSHTPIGKYSIHRLVNTLNILALTFATFTGKMMDETWLPRGELNHFAYFLHLISLVLLILTISLHLLTISQIGGKELIMSMLKWGYIDKDSPQHWPGKIQNFIRNYRQIIQREWNRIPAFSKKVELAILLAIVMAWVISILKSI
ncbi:MAG: cytochrome b/b6 domain-containing protein [Geminocystis sp.]|nr:cytochrome b/b6 domain-containing protein [Geminocystis sp.]HIK38200.1 cytochrome b/b6 domain-containing protein [Geminocystis sp. M7585_C2015_104]MCS7148662.1 cytochrome b/b6 domain-containing protein [Geminocystis sp.]MCX8078192.1 cytochrome b/b6 domain-containing protein [Geminocystis sp.]MDW8115076.1 cytochrome b/b6 domain-containing protein [Geminocystis sp.]